MANSEDGPVERPERNPRDARPQRPQADRSRAPRGEAERSGYPADDRYWTDYLRVALPVLGLLVLVGLLWYWASAIIGDGQAEPPVEPSVIAMVTPVMPATPPPVIQPTPPAIPLTPGLPATGSQPAIPPTQPMIVPPTAPVVTPVVQSTLPPTPAVIDASNPCAGLPSYELGTTIVTTEEVNLRDAPSTDGSAIRVLPPGTDLVTSGEAVEAGQCDWWPVSVMETGEQGFVIEQFVRLGQQ